MLNWRFSGRLIGGLLLSAMLLGIWNNFGFAATLFGGAGFMSNGAAPGAGLSFGLSALLAVGTSALGLSIACLLFTLLRTRQPLLALGYLAVVIASFATTMAEQSSFLVMRSLSQHYAAVTEVATVDAQLFDGLRAVVAGSRNAVHYLDKLVGGGAMLMFYLLLWRARLVPRALSGVSALAALLQMVGISMALCDLHMPMLMLAPMALTLLLLCLWLLVKGFATPATAPTG